MKNIFMLEKNTDTISTESTQMRDFGSHEGAQVFLDMKRIVHNFVNPHMSLKGKTPSEVADIDLKLDRRKLLNLIRHVSRYHTPIR